MQLGPGDWYTNAPLSPGPGNELAGVKGGMNGLSSTNPAGTVIHPVAAFSGGAVIDMADGSKGNRIRDLALLNDLRTGAGWDGIHMPPERQQPVGAAGFHLPGHRAWHRVLPAR